MQTVHYVKKSLTTSREKEENPKRLKGKNKKGCLLFNADTLSIVESSTTYWTMSRGKEE